MKVYVPFFICSIVFIVVIFFMYNPAYDYILKNNIYGYSTESFDVIVKEKLYLDKYYTYIDCHITNDEFDMENNEVYIKIDDCNIDIVKVNHLLKYYSKVDVFEMLTLEFDYTLINDDNYKEVLYLFDEEYFISNRLSRYLNFEGDDALINVNLNHDLIEYKDYTLVENISELVVVNKFNKLNDVNKDLSYCLGYYVYSADMCNNMKDFLSELKNSNISYTILKTYSRNDLFDEHATGLALDLDYDYSYDNLVEEIASRYGFIYRYKDEYNTVTSIVEQGHFRYVGDSSLEIYQLQLSLEQYIYYKSF